MANRSASRRVNRKKGGGKHRAERRTPEVVTWLGAGAITLGMGAAMASGTGVASAETASDSSSSSSSSASDSSSNSPNSESKTESVSSSTSTSSASSISSTSESESTKESKSSSFGDDQDDEISDRSVADEDAGSTELSSGVDRPRGSIATDVSVEVVSLPEADPIDKTPAPEPPATSLLALPVAASREVSGASETAAVIVPANVAPPTVQRAATASPQVGTTAAAGPVTSVPVGDEAKGFYIGPDDRVYVLADNRLTVLNKNNVIVGVTEVGYGSNTITVSPDGRKILIFDMVGTLNVYDSQTLLRVGNTLNFGTLPSFPKVNPAGNRAYFIDGDGVFTVLSIGSTSHSVVASLPIEFARDLVLSDDGRRAYVQTEDFEGRGGFVVVDTATNTEIASIDVGGDMYSPQLNKSGTRLYVFTGGRLGVIDTTTNKFLGSVGVGPDPMWYRLSPDGRRAYVTGGSSNSVYVIDTAARRVVSTIKTGNYPIGIAMAQDGKRFYVFNEGSGSISTVDTASGRVVATTPVGGSISIALSRDGQRIYGMDWERNSLTVVSVPSAPSTQSPFVQAINNVVTAVRNFADAVVTVVNQVVTQAELAVRSWVDNAIAEFEWNAKASAPSNVGDLYLRLRSATEFAPSSIYIEKLQTARVGGEERFIVYIGGTIPSNLWGNNQSVYENLPSIQGRLKQHQVEAIAAVVGNSPAKIMLVGYSQGGMDAQNLAASGMFNVTTVVTFGSPVTQPPSGQYRTIHLHAVLDPVPGIQPTDYLRNLYAQNRDAGNIYRVRPANVDYWYLLRDPFGNNIHGDKASYKSVGDKFNSSSGYTDVKYNISRFRGKVMSNYKL